MLEVFDAVAAALGVDGVVPLAWSPATRVEGQAEHLVWEATLPGSWAGLLFIRHGPADRWSWARSAPAADGPRLQISASRWPGSRTVSFGAAFHRAIVPSVAVTMDEPPRLAPSLRAGRAEIVAALAGVEMALLILPPEVTRVGRNHLWRVRDPLAARLPDDAREALSRGRHGKLMR